MIHKKLQQEKAKELGKQEETLDTVIMGFKDKWNPFLLRGDLRLLGVPRGLAYKKAREYEVNLYNPILQGYEMNKKVYK